MSSKIIEPNYNLPKVLRDAINFVEKNTPYNNPDAMFPQNDGSANIGYKNAIHNLERFAVENECKQIDSGDLCKKCNIGKIALMSAMVGNAEMDCEPYEEGVKFGDNESIQLQDYITLSIHACDSCGYVHSVNIE